MTANGERPATPSPHAGTHPDAERLWQAAEELRGPLADTDTYKAGAIREEHNQPG